MRDDIAMRPDPSAPRIFRAEPFPAPAEDA